MGSHPRGPTGTEQPGPPGAKGPAPDPLGGVREMTPEEYRLWQQQWSQERHQRRMQLMRMQGEVTRQERRLTWLWIVAGVLGVLALIGSTL